MKSRGFALILVIWVLVLLTAIGAGFSTLVGVETRSASWAGEKVRFQSAALAAIHRAILHLKDVESQDGWKVDGIANNWQWQGFEVQLIIRYEAGKVDLNYAPRPILSGLFRQLLPDADANALSGALLDWRDRDDKESEQGAEESAYKAAGYARSPANAPLTSISELSQVLGFDSQMVEVLRPHVTIFARSAKLDASTASATVLRALPDADPVQVSAFMAHRMEAYASGETPDFGMLGVSKQWIETGRKSGVLNLEALVRKDGRSHRERAIVRLQSPIGHYQVLAWETLMDVGTQP